MTTFRIFINIHINEHSVIEALYIHQYRCTKSLNPKFWPILTYSNFALAIVHIYVYCKLPIIGLQCKFYNQHQDHDMKILMIRSVAGFYRHYI